MEERFLEDVALLRKSLSGKLSLDEQCKLDKLLARPALKRIHEQLKDGKFLQKEFDKYAGYSPREGYLKFENLILRNKLRRTVRAMSVAALLLAGVITSIFVLSDRDDRHHSEMAVIRPGSSKAVLTLADGRTVEISDRQPLDLQEQGVDIRAGEGSLAYSVKEQSAETTWHEMNVPGGGEFHFVLGDGTQVWLNAGTRLKYPANMAGRVRELFLDGEAYFDVKKDGRPFIVSTGFGKIEVLGTRFGITGYNDDSHLTATLQTGSIRFTSDGGNSLELFPGEQVTADREGHLEKRRVDTDEYLGWKDGLYVFAQKPLEDIMTTFGRWYNVSVAYTDPGIARIRFTGNVRRYDNINTFLEALSVTQEVDYRIEGNTITLSNSTK